MYAWFQLAGGFKNKLALGLKFLSPVGKSAHYATCPLGQTHQQIVQTDKSRAFTGPVRRYQWKII